MGDLQVVERQDRFSLLYNPPPLFIALVSLGRGSSLEPAVGLWEALYFLQVEEFTEYGGIQPKRTQLFAFPTSFPVVPAHDSEVLRLILSL